MNYYSVPQIQVDGITIQYNDGFHCQPFFGFTDGQVVVIEPGSEHSEGRYKRFLRDSDLCLLGRIFSVDSTDEVIAVYERERRDGTADKISDALCIQICKNALKKSAFKGSSYKCINANHNGQVFQLNLNENKAHRLLRGVIMESLKANGIRLNEGHLDNVYGSDNFKRWFSGSKIVDENGQPRLLGHATRNFGFNKFNTPYIHLAPINDAAYFSGGNKRMFRYKKTLDKLSPEELVNLYNKHFAYSEKYHVLDSSAQERITKAYEDEIAKLHTAEEQDELRRYGHDPEKELEVVNTTYAMFKHIVQRYGDSIYYKEFQNGMLRLAPASWNITSKKDKAYELWSKGTFCTLNRMKQILSSQMFDEDEYAGNGGTYALCARIVNPLYVNCQGRAWDSICISPQTCEAYNSIFDKYSELGWNKSGYNKGTWIRLDNESIAYIAQQLGYDGVVFKNIKEGSYGNVHMDETYIVFSTKQLKSPFENNGDFGDVEHIFK